MTGRAALVVVLVTASVVAVPAAAAQPEPEPVVEVPARPAGLRVHTEPGSLEVSVDWDDVDGATSYWVRWRLAGPGNDLNEGVEVEASEATITVDGHGEWVVRVQACNDAGCGKPLAERFKVEPAPEPEQAPEESESESELEQALEESESELEQALEESESELEQALEESESESELEQALEESELELLEQALEESESALEQALRSESELGIASLLRAASSSTNQSTSVALNLSHELLHEAQGSTNVTVTATLTTGVLASDTTVTLSLSGTATRGTDYNVFSPLPTITIAAGDREGSADLLLLPVTDGTAESVETIVVGGTASGGLTVTSDLISLRDSAIGDYVDLSASVTTVAESAGQVEVVVTATKSQASLATNTIQLSLRGSASVLDDYGLHATASTNISIPSDSLSATSRFTVVILDDDLVEGTETIVIDAVNSTADLYHFRNLAEIQITDDDNASLLISNSAAAATEEGTPPVDAQLTVTLSAQVQASFSVGWRATPGTAIASDYTPTSGRITFPAGSAAGATQSISISAVDDRLSETEETFAVSLHSVVGSAASRINENPLASGTAIIAESDPITIQLTGPATIPEGDTGTYTIALKPDGVIHTADLIVRYTTGPDTATENVDYTIAWGELSIAPGAPPTWDFTVVTIEDTLDEPDETFSVVLYLPSGGGGPAPIVDPAKTLVTTTIIDDDGTPSAVTLTADPASLAESDSATEVTVTATLEGTSTLSSDVVVTVSLGGTAGSDDYSASSLETLTITAGSLSATGTLTVTPVDDEIVEGDETIEVSGTTAGFTVTPATVTITDNDTAVLSVSGPSSAVSEGAAAAFTVTLSKQIAKQVSVAWTAAGSGTPAASASDLGSTSGSAVFAADSAAGATQTVSITAVDDALSELEEGFTLTLGAVTSVVSDRVSVSGTATSAGATIAESDPITVQLTGPATVDEGDATGDYSVSLSPSGVIPTADLTVSWHTIAGTADSFLDYLAQYKTLTFTQSAPGAQTFAVSTHEDSLDEPDETFQVWLTTPSGGGGSAPSLDANRSRVTTTITDDDDTPSAVTLSASPSTLQESASATEVTISATLEGSSTRLNDLVVAVSLGGTAGSGDYSASSLASITIPAGSINGSGAFTVTPTQDEIVEGDETIEISGEATDFTITSASITITDDDTATASVAGPSSAVAEGAVAAFTVELSKQVAAEVSVAWTATGSGTPAASASDLGSTSGSAVFAADSAAGATQTVSISAVDDVLSELAEGFTLSLGAVTSDLSGRVSVSATAGSAGASIAESDPITVQITGPAAVDEGDATGDYTVALKPDGVIPTAGLTVNWATSAGTATEGDDYTAGSGTLTFTQSAAGAQTFTVSTIEDSLDEPNETFDVTLSNPSGGGGPAPSLDSARTKVTTTITDDDGTPSKVTLTASPASLAEDAAATDVTVTATLEGSSTLTSDLVVTVSLGGTAGSGDYSVVTALASITIDGGSSSGSGTLRVDPTDDEIVEGDEAITVSGTATGFTVAPATVTITDDDTAVLSVSGPSSAVSEGSAAAFTVELSEQVAAAVSVAWTAAGGTAAASDLSSASGSAVFAANSAAGATQSVSITAVDDALSEGAETFTFTLGAVTSDLSDRVSSAGSVGATISESDPITVQITGPATVNEGDATGNYSVALKPDGVIPTADLTVDYEASDGTAEEGTDYTAASNTLTFTSTAAGAQTFTVSTIEDSVDEPDETFDVTLSSLSGGGGPAPSLDANRTKVTTTITDNDDAPSSVTLSVDPSMLAEGATATDVTITATLEGSSTLPDDLVVSLSLGGTAGSGDYSASSLASITIPAGDSSATGTLTVTPTDDEIVEGDETITVSGSAGSLTVASASITITDDDSAELSVARSSSSAVSEGSAAAFTVTLSKQVAAQVSVAWTAAGSGTPAASASDLSSASGSAVFAANSAADATQTVWVTTADDLLSELAEGFTLSLGSVTSDVSSRVSVSSTAGSAEASIAASDPITVQITGPTTVVEGDTTGNYSVALRPDGVTPTADLTVSWATSADSPRTATEGTDYTAGSGTLTFTSTAAGAKTFTVATTEDNVDEPNETFDVTLSSLSGGGGPTPSLDANRTKVTTTITDDDGAPSSVTLSVGTASLAESASATDVVVTATLDGSTTRASDLEVAVSLGGTAGSGDYTVVTALASITIPANSSSGSGTLKVDPTQDEIVEGDETITVSGTATGFTITSASITITDDDTAELSVSGPSSAVSEGSAAAFTVTLTKQVAAQVSVAWTAAGGTAAAADLSSTSGSAVFAANSAADATKTVSITAVDDALSEGAETFTLTLGAVTSDLSGRVSLSDTDDSAGATIAASDPITVQITGPSAVDEGDATGNYSVALKPDGVIPTADLTVNYATSDGTAEEGDDYTAGSGTLTFTSTAAGAQTFTVATTEDTLDEPNETFDVTLSSLSGGGGPAPSLDTARTKVTTTITDDDGTPSSVTLSASPASLAEGASATDVTVTATLDGDSTRTSDLVVSLTLGGTAGSGDYSASTLANITIAAGSSSAMATLTVTPTDDEIVEGDETITVSGTATGFTIMSASITITDDDSAELSVSGPSSSVSEGSAAAFTVTLSKQVAAQVSVAWTAAGSGTNAAEASDLGSMSGSAVFAANSAADATKTVSITAADDALSEGAETFTLTLGSVTSDLSGRVSLSSSAGSAQASISASDPITVQITGPANVDEGDTTGSYSVALKPDGVIPTADLTVNWAAGGGTATSGTDYTAASGTLTFTSTAAGAQTFTVTTLDDNVDEPNETFDVTLSSLSGGGGPDPSLDAARTKVTTTITDDDGTPSSVTLSASPGSLAESASATDVTITATLDGGSTRTDDLVVAVSLGGTAGAGDYTASALASITIDGGSSSGSGTLTVDPTQDAIVEGNETITVSGTATGFTITSASITITDDDTAELSVSGPSSAVSEGSAAAFTVTLSKQVAAEVSVAWTAAGGTAEAADLSSTSGTATFAANSAAGATRTVSITAVDDALSEGAETFTLTLGAVTSDLSSLVSVLSTAGSAQATISESDPITVQITGPATVSEGDATGNYRVALKPDGVTPTADLTVNFAAGGGTATSGTDYTAASGTLTFTQSDAGAQTRTVATTEDTLDEPNETFDVVLSSLSGGGGPAPSLDAARTKVTTTITDDDGTPSSVTLTVDTASLAESATATDVVVTATLDGDSTLTSDLVVTVSLGGTAGAGDYTASTLASITIPTGESSATGTLTVTPTDDEIVEGDETITVSGTATDFTITSASITITDNDTATVSVAGPSLAVAEGALAAFTVTLSNQVAAEVSVAWTAAGSGESAASTAESTTDLSRVWGSAVFTADSASGATRTVSITAVDDALSELAEDFTLTLGAVTSDLSDRVSLSDTDSAGATIAASDPITVQITGPSTVSEGDATDYRVALSPSGVTPTADLTVDWATLAGTATEEDDYTAGSGTLTFTQAAPDAQTLMVSTEEDTLEESDETFEVTLSNPSGGGGPPPSLDANRTKVTTTITDDDGLRPEPVTPSGSGPRSTAVRVSAPPEVVVEGSEAVFTVTLSHEVAAEVSVAWEVVGGSADASDFSPGSGLVVFEAGSPAGATRTVAIAVVEDLFLEPEETLELRLGAVTSELSDRVWVSPEEGSASAVIAANGPAAAAVSGPASVTEGGTASFEVWLEPRGAVPSVDVVVEYSTAAGSAEGSAAAGSVSGPAASKGDFVSVSAEVSARAGSVSGPAVSRGDFVPVSGSLVFAAGSSASQTVAVSTVQDSLHEDIEGFVLEVFDPSGEFEGASARAVIVDDDPAPVSVSLSVSRSRLREGDPARQVTVTATLDGASTRTEDTTVALSFGGSATPDADYRVRPRRSVTIPAGHSSATASITITPTQDAVIEGDETIVLSGTAARLAVTAATITITDDDTAPPSVWGSTGKVAVSGPATVAEGAEAVFEVWLEPRGAVPSVDVVVQYSTASGSAVPGRDFAEASGELVFAAGSPASQTVAVQTVGDSLHEDGESFELEVFDPAGVFAGASAGTVITDDDPAPVSVSLSSSRSWLLEADPAAELTVTAAFDGASTCTEDTIVAITLGGAAARDEDYSASPPASVTIPAGRSSGSAVITVTPVGDAVVESDEAIVVSGAAVGLVVRPASIAIVDDDRALLGAAGPSAPVVEGSEAELVVTLSHEVAAGVLVAWEVVGSSADASDFSPGSGLVAFAADSPAGATRTVAITVAEDVFFEPAETFELRLGTVTSELRDRVSVSPEAGSASAVIAANGPAAIAVSGPVAVAEGGEAVFEVWLEPRGAVPSVDVVVEYSTAAASATSGRDFAPVSGSLVFAAGSSASQTVAVRTVQDSLHEGSEGFVLAVFDPSGAAEGGSAGTVIADDDPAPVSVSLSVSQSSLPETGPAAEMTLTAAIDGASTRAEDTEVVLSLGGPATPDVDYTVSVPASITIPAGRTRGSASITITPIGDAVVESDEAIVVSGTAAQLAVSPVSIAIVDDDTAHLSVSGPSGAAAEGSMATFTVTMSKQVAAEVLVAWAVGGGSADASDFSPGSGLAVFEADAPAGATRTVAITAAHDIFFEPEETFELRLGAVTSALSDRVSVSPRAGSASAVIAADDPVDDPVTVPAEAAPRRVDGETAQLSVSGPSDAVVEGSEAVFVVTLSDEVAAGVSVAWAVVGGSADASDFSPGSGLVVFEADSSAGATRTVVITAAEDIFFEPAETLELRLGEVTSALPDRVSVSPTEGSTSAVIAANGPSAISVSGPATVAEGADAVFEVWLEPRGLVPSADVVVEYATVTGSAVSGRDFMPVSGSLVFAAGSSASQTVAVRTVQDNLHEDGEGFALEVFDPSGAAEGGSAGTVIADDDPAPVSVTLSAGVAAIDEGGRARQVTVTATLDGDVVLGSDTTVALSLGGSATPGGDYNARPPRSVTIPAGRSSATTKITITPTEDAVVEGDETIVVSGTAAQLAVSPASITIVDDDTARLSVTGPRCRQPDARGQSHPQRDSNPCYRRERPAS